MVVVATIKDTVVAYLSVIEGSLIEPYIDWHSVWLCSNRHNCKSLHNQYRKAHSVVFRYYCVDGKEKRLGRRRERNRVRQERNKDKQGL